MKKKIITLLICFLFIINAISLLGLVEESKNVTITYQSPTNNYRLKVKHLNDGRLPPNPGEMPEDFIIKIAEKKIIDKSPYKIASYANEAIVEIIQKIDDELILGYLENITDFGPRLTGSPACEQAGEYIYNEFVSYGLEARYDDWEYYGYSGNNIEGTLYGINESSDEIYIICAHYDSVSSNPGADDDGSGTAAVLAAANIMSQYQFEHTIRFVAFDGEEQGLLGSYRYAEEAFNNRDNIIAALNGDMIGYAENPTQASYIKIYENSISEWITDYTEDIIQIYNDFIKLTIVPSGTAYNSDHASFWNFDYSVIMYHEYEFNPYYHSSQNIIENMDVNYSTRVLKLIIATLGELAEFNTPPNKPTITGPSTASEGEKITFYLNTTDPEGHDLYYYVDWGDGNNSGWFGPFLSGEIVEVSYIFETISEYDIKLQAKDIKNSRSGWSDIHHITIIENISPNKPIISGPKIATTGKELEFKVSADDPENHDVYYYVFWDDGTNIKWEGPYSSGEQVTFTHKYTNGGSFTIIIKARDYIGKTGQQNQHKLFIIKNKAVNNSILLLLYEKIIARFPFLGRLLD